MKTFSMITFGCKVNQYDTYQLKKKFLQAGLKETAYPEKSDICLINTCTVTARADQKARKLIRKIHQLNPNAYIVITGCYGSAKEDREELQTLPGVRLIVANKDKSKIFEKLPLPPIEQNHPIPTSPLPQIGQRNRVYLKIQDGCNLMCTFCKIPYVRGQLTSTPPEKILEEAKRYIEQGFQEIVITGVHLGLYGWRKNNQYRLWKVLEKLAKLPGLGRIRLSSLEANEITLELIQVVQNEEKICPHFHIPLQSGDDRILQLMNRKYTQKEFLKKIELLHQYLDFPGLTTDVIYGFPTETEQNFQQTLRVLQLAQFHRVHAFPFSPRRRTPAYHMEPKVRPEEMKLRKKQLIQTSQEINLQLRQRMLGKTVQVLVESNQETEHFTGYCQRYFKCYLEEKIPPNTILSLQVKELFEDGLKCKKI
ncbi:MAG: tRNA (N(6)-L-threonylcarbamoyladenosine(37)-C(2))-methylthiotransferase MtaB [Planctomycetota bacterium]|nr:MAG: tRNA (N(6)-L-threonylcarbamoyladenosine(37)-C(2))-methylthiotransferase MtaB [Planctomycetota bacterium]